MITILQAIFIPTQVRSLLHAHSLLPILEMIHFFFVVVDLLFGRDFLCHCYIAFWIRKWNRRFAIASRYGVNVGILATTLKWIIESIAMAYQRNIHRHVRAPKAYGKFHLSSTNKLYWLSVVVVVAVAFFFIPSAHVKEKTLHLFRCCLVCVLYTHQAANDVSFYLVMGWIGLSFWFRNVINMHHL